MKNRNYICEMVKAVIFDMDGLLIDSEPLWREAEVAVFNGIGVPLTEQDCFQTMGLRIDEVVEYWYERYPWEGVDKTWLADTIVSRVGALFLEKGKPLPGVDAIVDFFKNKELSLALASSSPMRLISAGLKALNLENTFGIVHSAEYEAYGKPHPAIYLTTLNKLGVAAEECIAFEDSVNGLKAAVGAGIPTVAVPEGEAYDNPEYKLAALKLRSLEEFGEAQFNNLQK